jgi:hypothetical protein
MEEAGVGQATCAIAMTVGRDRETFASPDQFLGAATPEGLRRFTSLELRVEGDGLELVAAFERPPRRGLRSGGPHAASLQVTPHDESRSADALAVAQAVAATLSRGYARYWADCACAPELREQAGRPLRFREALVLLVVMFVGALLGAGLARVLDALPGFQLSPLAGLILLVGAGALYPALVTRLVLNVEVAPAGRTRLRSVALKSAAVLVTFAATQAIQLAAG